MKIKVTTLTVSHEHGINLSVCASRAAAEAELDSYCQEWWADVPDGLPMPEDAAERIQLYFEGVEGEDYDIEDHEVVIDLPLLDLAREALSYEREAFEQDEEVNGGDLVEWFADWRERLKALVELP